jgi:hypothetical protein
LSAAVAIEDSRESIEVTINLRIENPPDVF